MIEAARDKVDRFLVFPVQVVVLFSAIILVEAGTRAHNVWKRKFDEDLS